MKNRISSSIYASIDAELFYTESQTLSTNITEKKHESENTICCCFCRAKGHTIDLCFKKKKKYEQQQNQHQRINLSASQGEI